MASPHSTAAMYRYSGALYRVRAASQTNAANPPIQGSIGSTPGNVTECCPSLIVQRSWMQSTMICGSADTTKRARAP